MSELSIKIAKQSCSDALAFTLLLHNFAADVMGPSSSKDNSTAMENYFLIQRSLYLKHKRSRINNQELRCHFTAATEQKNVKMHVELTNTEAFFSLQCAKEKTQASENY